MFGLTEDSYRQHGAVIWPIDESEVDEIRPFLAALHEDGWFADTDYEVDYSRNDQYSKPWRHRIECSKDDGNNVTLDVFKRPHSKGFFKGKFLFSVEVGVDENGEMKSLGFTADRSHIAALRNGLKIYFGQLDAHKLEFGALEETNADMKLVLGR
jgi:hypothetical protein